MSTDPKQSWSHLQAGISLIELVMFIVIVSVGIVGILSVMNVTTAASADPMIRKQAIAIAESLLEEVELQPFTFCDPDDTQAATATSATVGAAGCATTVQGITPTNLEGRLSATAPFDNVGDYGGFSMSPVTNLAGDSPAALAPFAAAVTLTQQGAVFGLAADAVLRIDVRVTGPSSTDLTLSGFRFRYAPNAVP